MATAMRPADLVEEALVRVDTASLREFGPDETAWTPGQRREYFLRLEAAHLDPGSVITT